MSDKEGFNHRIWIYPVVLLAGVAVMGGVVFLVSKAQGPYVAPSPVRTIAKPAMSEPINTPLVHKDADMFVWDPKGSESGTLLVLLPRKLEEKPFKCTLMIAGLGERIELEEGLFAGNRPDGRAAYVFGRPGGEYPLQSFIVVNMRYGKSHEWRVKKTGLMYKEARYLD